MSVPTLLFYKLMLLSGGGSVDHSAWRWLLLLIVFLLDGHAAAVLSIFNLVSLLVVTRSEEWTARTIRLIDAGWPRSLDPHAVGQQRHRKSSAKRRRSGRRR